MCACVLFDYDDLKRLLFGLRGMGAACGPRVCTAGRPHTQQQQLCVCVCAPVSSAAALSWPPLAAVALSLHAIHWNWREWSVEVECGGGVWGVEGGIGGNGVQLKNK